MATYVVEPLFRPIDAVVAVPGSKSIANRALICAALADGPSTFHNLPAGDDTEAMLSCLDVLGIGVERSTGPTTICGSGGVLPPGPRVLPTRLAGTTSRFVTALAALGAGPYMIDGAPPLRARPMAPLHDALVALGATISGERRGHLPVTVSGPLRASERLHVRGDISSQFLTALMLIGPHVPGGLHVTITTPLVSRPYLLITQAVMAEFGHAAVSVDDREIDRFPSQCQTAGHLAVGGAGGRIATRVIVGQDDARAAMAGGDSRRRWCRGVLCLARRIYFWPRSM